MLSHFREDIYVALGSIYRNARGAQIIRAQWTKIHPKYLTSSANDLGLIKLRRPAILGKYGLKLISIFSNISLQGISRRTSSVFKEKKSNWLSCTQTATRI